MKEKKKKGEEEEERKKRKKEREEEEGRRRRGVEKSTVKKGGTRVTPLQSPPHHPRRNQGRRLIIRLVTMVTRKEEVQKKKRKRPLTLLFDLRQWRQRTQVFPRPDQSTGAILHGEAQTLGGILGTAAFASATRTSFSLFRTRLEFIFKVGAALQNSENIPLEWQ